MFEDKEVIKVLSVDGGGIRGIIPVLLLKKIEDTTGKKIYELFDFIAGTSTGALLSIFLNKEKPASASKLLQLYEDYGQIIFPPTLNDKNGLKGCLRKFFGNKSDALFKGPKYTSNGMNLVLQHLMKDMTLSQTLTPMMLTAYETEKRRPVFFTNYEKQYSHLKIKDVARAVSAAPTYFEPVKIGNGTFMDGAVCANNPALCAYTEILKLLKNEGINPGTKKIIIVSIGTGASNSSFDFEKSKNWSALEWIEGPLLPSFYDANSRAVDYQMSNILPSDEYYRFQIELPNLADVEDIDNTQKKHLQFLKNLTIKYITNDTIALNQSGWRSRVKEICNVLSQRQFTETKQLVCGF